MDNTEKKDYLKILFVITIITIAAESLGLYFHWHFILSVGTVATVFVVLAIIGLIFGDYQGATPGCFSLLALPLFLYLYFGCDETRYISSHDDKQHLYKDCPQIVKYSSDQMTELEGFYHLVFSECKDCKKRKREKQKEREIAIEQNKRNEMIDYLQGLIDDLENGATADDVIEQIIEDLCSEEEAGNYETPGIPSRYR